VEVDPARSGVPALLLLLECVEVAVDDASLAFGSVRVSWRHASVELGARFLVRETGGTGSSTACFSCEWHPYRGSAVALSALGLLPRPHFGATSSLGVRLSLPNKLEVSAPTLFALLDAWGAGYFHLAPLYAAGGTAPTRVATAHAWVHITELSVHIASVGVVADAPLSGGAAPWRQWVRAAVGKALHDVGAPFCVHDVTVDGARGLVRHALQSNWPSFLVSVAKNGFAVVPMLFEVCSTI
jgi:hypothetical protein